MWDNLFSHNVNNQGHISWWEKLQNTQSTVFPRPRVGMPLMADVTGYGRRHGWLMYPIEDVNHQAAAQGSSPTTLSPPLPVAFNVERHFLVMHCIW